MIYPIALIIDLEESFQICRKITSWKQKVSGLCIALINNEIKIGTWKFYLIKLESNRFQPGRNDAESGYFTLQSEYFSNYLEENFQL